jgi:hypothetical protein
MKRKLSGKNVFRRMQRMATDARNATGAYCSIKVEGLAFTQSEPVTRFNLYIDLTETGEFFEFDNFSQMQDFVDHLR